MLITETTLARLAGERSYARGVAYFESGAVAELDEARERIRARVVGGEEYDVVIRAERGALAHSCTCPVGESGEFCKHAVAAGLAWLASREGGDDESTPDSGDAVRRHLESMDKRALVSLILSLAEDDAELRGRLESRALGGAAKADIAAIKALIRKALAVHGFVDYRGMRRLVARAHSVLELLGDLVRRGNAGTAAEAAEYALRLGLSSYENTDDSGGGFGEALRQLAAVHLDARKRAPGDSAALAKTLFELFLRDHWGFFRFEDYAPLLGAPGLARFRKLAETAWAKVPARTPDDRRSGFDIGHFKISSLMEAIARWDGDIERLIEIKGRDLTTAHAFLGIAEILDQAGRADEALAWAGRGHEAFRDEQHEPLLDYLVSAYARCGRDADALALAWDRFRRWPGLGAYQRLKKCAGRGKDWPAWRAKALAQIREVSVRESRADRGSIWRLTGNSLLVEIFLWEGDADAALIEAMAGGCTEHLWLQLAQALEAGRPEEAASIYQARIEPIVARTGNRAYDEAAALIARVKSLMRRTGRERDYAAWLDVLRSRHKAKRNFIARIERLG